MVVAYLPSYHNLINDEAIMSVLKSMKGDGAMRATNVVVQMNMKEIIVIRSSNVKMMVKLLMEGSHYLYAWKNVY